MIVRLHSGVSAESLGDNVVLFDSRTNQVFRADHRGITVIDGNTLTIDRAVDPHVAHFLRTLGDTPSHSSVVSRRAVLGGTGAAVAGGVVALGLPVAAAASSNAPQLATRSAFYYWDGGPPTLFNVYVSVFKATFPEINDANFNYGGGGAPGEWSVELFLPGATLVLDKPYWDGGGLVGREGWWWEDRNSPQTSGPIFDGLVALYAIDPNGPDIEGRLLRNGVPYVNLELTEGEVGRV